MSAAVGFFQSRWAPAPEHVRDLGASATLPDGFRAAGVGCGIKAGGELDLGLLVCDSEAAVSAARFCRSGVLAAPVIICQERCRLDSLRAVVANSGNANAATSRAGLDEAARVQGAARIAARPDPATAAPPSPGLI